MLVLGVIIGLPLVLAVSVAGVLVESLSPGELKRMGVKRRS